MYQCEICKKVFRLMQSRRSGDGRHVKFDCRFFQQPQRVTDSMKELP